MTLSLFDQYEQGMAPYRKTFAEGLNKLLAVTQDRQLMQRFLLYFAAFGVKMVRPVEDWLLRSAQACEDKGFAKVGKALRGHAASEAGHDQMMYRDMLGHAARLEVDAMELLNMQPTAGVLSYMDLHEKIIASQTPWRQVALQYEIELLPVNFGDAIIETAKAVMGDGITLSMEFIVEHVVLDVGHSHFNKRQLENVLLLDPGSVQMCVDVGRQALETYGAFLSDCLEFAQR